LPNTNDVIDLNSLTINIQKHFLKHFYILPLNPTFSLGNIIKELRKTEKRVSRLKACDHLLTNKMTYLRSAVMHLSTIRLSPKVNYEFSSVVKSYTTENKKIMALRVRDKFIGLSDSMGGFLRKDTIFKTYEGDLSKITMELDLSYPTNDVVEDIKKEISLWKQAKKAYSRGKQKHQHLSDKDVKRMLRIYELRGQNIKYKRIAKKIFGTESIDSIQKTRNMFNKAKSYIDGGYKQIR